MRATIWYVTCLVTIILYWYIILTIKKILSKFHKIIWKLFKIFKNLKIWININVDATNYDRELDLYFTFGDFTRIQHNFIYHVVMGVIKCWDLFHATTYMMKTGNRLSSLNLLYWFSVCLCHVTQFVCVCLIDCSLLLLMKTICTLYVYRLYYLKYVLL